MLQRSAPPEDELSLPARQRVRAKAEAAGIGSSLRCATSSLCPGDACAARKLLNFGEHRAMLCCSHLLIWQLSDPKLKREYHSCDMFVKRLTKTTLDTVGFISRPGQYEESSSSGYAEHGGDYGVSYRASSSMSAHDGSNATPQTSQPPQMRAPMTHEQLEASLYNTHLSTASHAPQPMCALSLLRCAFFIQATLVEVMHV